MKRLSRVVVGALVAVLVPVLSLVGTPPAVATTTLGTVKDMVVDQAHGKVFLSEQHLSYTNLSGTLLGTVAGVGATVGDLSLSPDGSALLAVQGAAILVVDPSTSVLTKTVPTGDNVCPTSIAPASGKVFFFYKPCNAVSGSGQMGAVDLSTGVVTTGLAVNPPDFYETLQPIPGQPDALVANLTGSLQLIDTTGGSTPTATVRTSLEDGSRFGRFGVAPDGTRIVVARGAVGFHGYSAYSTTDLAPAGTFPINSNQDVNLGLVAVRADGLFSGTWGDFDYSYLRAYKAGSTTPFSERRYGMDQAPYVAAFGTKLLYAVSRKSASSASVLTVLTPGPPAALTLSSDRTVVPWRGTVTVAAKLASPTATRTVSIFITPYGGRERFLKSGTVSSSTNKLAVKVGDLKVNTTFRAVFTGDGTYAAASVSRLIKVAGKVAFTSRSTSLSGGYHRLATSPTPVVTGQVSAQRHGCTQLVGYRLVSGTWKRFDSIPCVHLTSLGRFTVGLVGFSRGSRLKITARFQGSAWNAPSPAATYYVLLT